MKNIICTSFATTALFFSTITTIILIASNGQATASQALQLSQPDKIPFLYTRPAADLFTSLDLETIRTYSGDSQTAFNLRYGNGSASGSSFIVAPEPIALLLYGLGGLPLVAHFLIRRKKPSA